METIKNYLDNMFSGLPKNEEMAKLKEDIYINMQDKYQELKTEGKSENEAIGIVISEFGNIEELMEEFNIKHDANEYEAVLETNQSKKPLPEVTMDIAKDYIRVKKTVGKFVGLGTLLCLIGIAFLIACQTLTGGLPMTIENEIWGIVGIVVMFVFIAGGVALFIYSGMIGSSYEYLEKPFNMSGYVKQHVQAKWDIVKPGNTVMLIIGICLCVLSPLPAIIGGFMDDTFGSGRDGVAILVGISLMLLIIAVAVYLIIYSGNVLSSYYRLLEIGDYTPAKKQGNKAIEAVASIVWPLVTITYLYIGFVHGMWHPGWVIFPITGVLFGAFSAIVEGVSRK